MENSSTLNMECRILVACVLSVSVLLLSACSGSDDSKPEVAFTILDCGGEPPYNSSYTEPSQQLIDNSHTWREVYMASALNRQMSVPEVDFTQQRVIAIHAGTKPSGGHTVVLTHIEDWGSHWQVYYQEGEPASCAADAAISYPYCFALVGLPGKPLYFTGEKTDSCR